MKKRAALAVLVMAFLGCSACGKKGELLPPIIRTPQKAERIHVFQRGRNAVLEWMNPTRSVDGTPLAGISEVEIWQMEAPLPAAEGAPPPDAETFAGRAKLAMAIRREDFQKYARIGPDESQEMSVSLKILDKPPFAGEYTFALRVRDDRERESEFSEPLSLTPRTVPSPPGSLSAAVFEDRIEVRWEAPKENIDGSSPAMIAGYSVYRAEGEGYPLALGAVLVKEPLYEDRDFAFGISYVYRVRASSTETAPFLESDDSEPVRVEAKDVFPPLAPARLTSIAGRGFIALSWDSAPEKDFAGYKVWRRLEEEEFSLLVSQLRENSYTDHTVEKKRRYYYAVSSLDHSGNEGPRTIVAADSLKD